MMIGDVRGVAHLEPLCSGRRISKGEQGHDEDWHKSPFHDFLKKSYLINTVEKEQPPDYSHAPPATPRKDATVKIVVMGDANADWLAFGLGDFAVIPKVYPRAEHPIVRTHPETGRRLVQSAREPAIPGATNI
jgi:hypothetical protein